MAIVSRHDRRVIAWQSYRGAAFQTSDYYITAIRFSAVTIAPTYIFLKKLYKIIITL
ncbi:MAG: hypothetical protein QHH74_06130 [Spirochaetota bacterium]|nr:hypothetical protein [Spirochaetota bacterium]